MCLLINENVIQFLNTIFLILQYELVAELFTDHTPAKDQKLKPGGKVKAMQVSPKGSNKQMKKTVGSQVRINCMYYPNSTFYS